MLARSTRAATPAVVFVILTCFTGLGFHAARDWHHHGELGAGFFHIHFHVGDHEHNHHEHGDHDHDHNRPGSDHETPDDPGHRPPHRQAVLTINHAYQHPAPPAPAVVAVESAPECAIVVEVLVPRASNPVRVVQPRAPPV